MRALSERQYWSKLYDGHNHVPGRRPQVFDFILRSYADTVLWDRLISRYMPRHAHAKVIEIGSAPGANLLRFHRRFGCDVYGVEYTESGVAQNRALFAAHGIDPAHVIHADAFSSEFLSRYESAFEIVFSQGFIEHFDDPSRAVAVHLAVLANHGLLIVVIPNVRGVNDILGRFFNYESYAIHNTGIMRLDVFQSLFDRPGVRPLYCGYCGGFSTHIFNAPSWTLRRVSLLAANVLNIPLQLLLRALPAGWRLEAASTSPYLVFIGRVER